MSADKQREKVAGDKQNPIATSKGGRPPHQILVWGVKSEPEARQSRAPRQNMFWRGEGERLTVVIAL